MPEIETFKQNGLFYFDVTGQNLNATALNKMILIYLDGGEQKEISISTVEINSTFVRGMVFGITNILGVKLGLQSGQETPVFWK